MKKLITITDRRNNLIASLEINWETREINIINQSAFKIQEDEAFAYIK